MMMKILFSREIEEESFRSILKRDSKYWQSIEFPTLSWPADKSLSDHFVHTA